MEIFKQLAGFSLGQADMIRRAMSKKKHKVIDAERVAFIHGDPSRSIDGAVKRGVSEEIANSIYDEIVDFASYAFNKAHAVSYAVVAYRTAYMKRHYGAEYMAALLTSILDNSTKVSEYIAECRDMGIRLLPPDVNESDANFTVSGGNIRFGLVAIKGIGWGVINTLVQERARNGRFESFEDFCRRMNGKDMNHRTVENLIKAGAFDGMGCKRKTLVEAAGAVLDGISRSAKENIMGQFGLFDQPEYDSGITTIAIPDTGEYTDREKMAFEKEVTGLYLSGHPMDGYRKVIDRIGAVPIGTLLNDFDSPDGPTRFVDNQRITVAGIISSIKTRTTKNNSLMSYVQLEDDTGAMELIVFQKTMDSCGAYMVADAAVTVSGRLSVRDEKEPQIMAEAIAPLSLDSLPAEEGEKISENSRLWVRLPGRDDPRLSRIELILTMFPGRQKLILWLEKENQRIGTSCLIHPALVAELKELLGDDSVIIK